MRDNGGPLGASLELLTPDEMGRADLAAVAAGTSIAALMARAGRAVADDMAEMIRPGAKLAVFCGPGNNGGDGFVAARLLSQRGFDVRVALLGAREALRGSVAEAAALWPAPVEHPSADLAAWADGAVDALFGAGLSRDISGPAADAVGLINKVAGPRLAVDLPSGVDGSTGAVRGAAVEATASATFFRRKPGHVLLPGRALCGRVRVHDIDIAAHVLGEIAPATFLNRPALWAAHLPRPDVAGHKYSRGHVVVLSGGMASTGAARLAAAAAQRAGAGAVTIASPPVALMVNAAHLTSIMLRSVAAPDELAALLRLRPASAGVLGPGAGVGEATRMNVLAALATPVPLVLDADALTSFEADPTALFAAIARRSAATVLTPHEGEFARLFPDQGTGSKLARARAAARRSSAVVLLKGPDTVISSPDGQAAINDNASWHLATAGSGDVLAGIIAALLAGGMQPFEAAAAGAYLHGAAGEAAGPGLIAEDLPAVLPAVLRSVMRA